MMIWDYHFSGYPEKCSVSQLEMVAWRIYLDTIFYK